MNYRKWRGVSRVMSALSCIFLLIGFLLKPRNIPMLAVGIAFFAAGFALSALKLKCPDCGTSIPDRFGVRSDCCPKCGKKL